RSLGHQHLIAAALIHPESHCHRATFARRRAEAGKPHESLAPSLRLLRVLAGNVPADVVLLVGDEPTLPIVRALLTEAPLFALRDECWIVADVRHRRPMLHMQD